MVKWILKPLWEIPGKVGEFDEDWKVVILCKFKWVCGKVCVADCHSYHHQYWVTSRSHSVFICQLAAETSVVTFVSCQIKLIVIRDQPNSRFHGREVFREIGRCLWKKHSLFCEFPVKFRNFPWISTNLVLFVKIFNLPVVENDILACLLPKCSSMMLSVIICLSPWHCGICGVFYFYIFNCWLVLDEKIQRRYMQIFCFTLTEHLKKAGEI